MIDPSRPLPEQVEQLARVRQSLEREVVTLERDRGPADVDFLPIWTRFHLSLFRLNQSVRKVWSLLVGLIAG